MRVYEFTTGDWLQMGSDLNGEAVGDLSGVSVSLSSDGSILAVGSRGNDTNGSNSGHVKIYEFTAGDWLQMGSNINGEANDDYSGYSVSLNETGSIIAIGAYRNSGNGNMAGHVRVYEFTTGTWLQMGSDIDGEDEGDESGSSVSLSADGSILAIGAPHNDGNGNQAGHVRIYEFTAGDWLQIGSDIDGESSGNVSGSSVSLNADGSILAIGAPRNNGYFATDSGHVRVYENSSVGIPTIKQKALSLYPNPTNGKINIEGKLIDFIEITTASGQVIYKQDVNSDRFTVDISNQNTGIYIINAVRNSAVSRHKLILNQ